MIRRPRNRQGRSQQSNGGRGRGRGGARSSHSGHAGSGQAVPGIDQVIPGAPVSLVLKIDQPTGREVQGFVAEVLTNGNHPRGIKVRLVDGRVGRVQRMVSEDEGRAGSAGLSGLGRNGEPLSQSSNGVSGEAPGFRARHRHRDVQLEDDVTTPRSGYDLEDFLPPSHPLRGNSDTVGSPQSPQAESTSEILVCPVCGQFEGDETAISHHVGTHFD